MLVIGLVGGVASGKSFVAECFEQLGACVLDADEFGHDVLDLPEVISQIRAIWPEVLDQEGRVDRKALANIVFESRGDTGVDQPLQTLERMTHPRIGKRVKQHLSELEAQNVSAVILDAPVLLKAGWQKMCDRIVYVETDLPNRQRRAASRGWDSHELLRRESFQNSLEEKRKCSTDIIDNSGTKNDTLRQVQALWLKWNLNAQSTDPPSF